MHVPAFLINREQDVARLAHARRTAVLLGFAVERVAAVNGAEVPGDLRPYFFDGRGRPFSNLLPGEIGCYASHLVCARLILARQIPAALVLEDDVVLDPAFAATVDAALESLAGRAWDIVRLSSPARRAVVSVAHLTPGHTLVRYSRAPKKSGAYLLSFDGARKLLKLVPRVRPIDADLRYDWLWRLETYGVEPPPAHQPETFGSSISVPVLPRRVVRGGRWPQPSVVSRVGGLVAAVARLGFIGFARCAWRNFWLRSRRATAYAGTAPRLAGS